MQDTQPISDSGKLFIDGDKVIRYVDNINSAKKIISAVEKKKLFGNTIVETDILDEKNKTVKHKLVSPIIHSGELTASMLADLTDLTIQLTQELVDEKIYSIDLLPHNFTYNKGHWFLYDFPALNIKPSHVKRQIRMTCNINFYTYELLRILKREQLKHYFLNIIKTKYFMKLIPLSRWLPLHIHKTIAILLCHFKQYKQAYKYMEKLHEKYKNSLKRELFKYNIEENSQKQQDIINKIITEHNTKNIFAIGEEAGIYAIESNTDKEFFVYLDNYDICDSYYNLIRLKEKKNISTAVIYPYLSDDTIDENHSYRAIYDNFAMERFKSDAVIFLNPEQLLTDKSQNPKIFIERLTQFSKNLLIIKIDKKLQENISLTEIKELLENEYSDINLENLNTDETLVIASEKRQEINNDPYKYTAQYNNKNRGNEANNQSRQILEIIKNCNN